MKLTKKVAALLLAASLAVSVCATPVFADGSEEGSNTKTSANTVVTYRVDCSYTWSVPAKIDFGANIGPNKSRIVEATADKNAESKAPTGYGGDQNGSAPKVCVTSNIINDDKTLYISIDTSTSSGTTYDKDAGYFYVVTDTNAAQKLQFDIEKSNDDKWNPLTDPVLTVASGTNTDEQGLNFSLYTLNGSAEKAGTYNGKVVFKSELKPTAPGVGG